MRKKFNPTTVAIAAASLAFAGIAPNPAPLPVAITQAGVSGQQNATQRDQAPAAASQVTPLDIAALGFGRTPARFRRKYPVWVGTRKLGNRKGRSRWNYGR